MAGKTFVTKGYSTYTDIPARRGGYDHGTKKPINQYVVDTKTFEQIRAPAAGYTDYGGSRSKSELLKEYVHAPSMSSGPKYASTNHYEGYEPNYGLNYENSSPPKYRPSSPIKYPPSIPNKYPPSSLVHGYPSEEAHLIHSRPGLEGARHVRTENFSGPNKTWQSAGPPATHHPLTTATNNINEAFSYLEKSVNSTRSDPRRRGVLDDMSTRAQPLEPERRYARPAFVAKPNDSHHNYTNTGSTIDSHEAARRYRGTLMP